MRAETYILELRFFKKLESRISCFSNKARDFFYCAIRMSGEKLIYIISSTYCSIEQYVEERLTLENLKIIQSF